MMRKSSLRGHVCFFAFLLMFLSCRQVVWSDETERWTIVTSPKLAKEAAIAAAVEDLQADGKELGLTFVHATQAPPTLDQTIVVGDATRNPLTAKLTADGTIQQQGVSNEQGFQIQTIRRPGGRLMVLAGGSVIGDVYGLYWLWDRMRVFKHIPDLNLTRSPAVPIRFVYAYDRSKLRQALRHSANWVCGGDVLDLVPWDSQPERARNQQHRRQLQKWIDAAHAYRMKFISRCDEFSCHPSLLEEFNAKLDPADPALWQALQEKYRRLFRALPDLDGIRIRTGELTLVKGSYLPFDIMHDPPESDWSNVKRYRTFVKKMHEVVVDEFDKIYMQRTWVTNTTEQHSSPAAYRETFTEDVPTRNLYLSPYMSLADRWYYQPYNPTFNLTPHNMLVSLATLDYHAHGGVNVFPSFPGAYFQGGLQSILAVENSNLQGVEFYFGGSQGWDSAGLTAYTSYRLAWDPNEDLEKIAEDFAAIHLGRDAAPKMAEILLLSHQAYKDGLYIKPVAESIRGNTLPHLRLTAFPMRGLPEIDRGAAHIAWLESSMYEPSKGHINESVEHLDRGLWAAIQMESRFQAIAERIENKKLANKIGDSLALTRLLVETHNRYVKACYAYFQYRERRNASHRAKLAAAVVALKDARGRFAESPGYCYQPMGVDQLIANAEEALAGLDRAEAILADAPRKSEMQKIIAAQQRRYFEALEAHAGDAIKVLSWHGKVDGRDLLCIRGEAVWIEHKSGDGITEAAHDLQTPLPRREVTVLLKDIESRDRRPFVIEQPTAENDFTAKIDFFDPSPSYGRWEIEIYYIDKPPENLGLSLPW